MNIDELNIKISSNTKSAKKGLDNLTETLKALSQIDLSNIQTLINGLEKISTAMMGSKSSSGGANGIAETVKETKKLKAVVAETSPKITAIKKTLNEMPSKSISRSLTETELKVIDNAAKRVEQANNRLSGTIPVTKDPDLPDGKKYMDYSQDESLKRLREELSLTDKEYENAFKSGQIHKTGEDWVRFRENVGETNSAFENVGNKSSSVVEKIKGSVTNTTPKIEELKAKLKELSNQGYTFGDKEFDTTYKDLYNNISDLKEYKAELENSSRLTKRLSSSLKKLKPVFNGLGKIAKSFGKTLSKACGKALKSGIRPLSEGVKRFKNMLKSMLMRSVLYSGLSAVREGFGQLAKEDGRFNKSMSKMYSALMTLKNAFVAAFAPIVNTVEPYITTLLNMLTSVVTKITQVIAALTGSSSATIAKKLTLDYADAMDESSSSTDKATKSNKEYKNSLIGIDEINKLNGENSSSNDSQTEDNFTTQFTTGGANDLAKRIKEAWENADFTNIGEIISSKIVGMLQGIDWEKIKSNAFKGGKSFATLINGIFKYTDEDGNTLASSIGKTVAEALNTLTNFLYGYVTSLEWGNIGSELSKNISSLFTNIEWEKIIKTSAKLGEGLATLLRHLFTDKDDNGNYVLSNVTTSVANIINAIVTFVKNAVNKLAEKDINGKSGWYKLGESISTALIKGILAINWNDLLETIGGVGKGIYDLLDGMFGAFFEINADTGRSYAADLWETIGKQIVAGILAGMVSVLALPFLGNTGGESAFKTIFTSIYDGLCDAFGIESPAKEMYPIGRYIVLGIIEGIREKIENIRTDIENKFNVFKDKISDWFTEKKSEFEKNGSALISDVITGMGDIWQRAKGKFENFKTNINNWFTEKVNNFRKLGSDLIDNIRDGIGDIWGKIKSKFINFWNSMKNYLGSNTLKLKVEWDTSSIVGQALSKVGLQGLPKLSFYESGGFPNIGELFVANEHGAEMVGSLNNKPAVANNQQIENALENAIYRGMMAAGTGENRSINLNVTVPLDDAVLGRAMVNYHNGFVRTTGESPLIIGV